MIEMQIICSRVDGIKVQLWEGITRYRTRTSKNGLRGRIEIGLLLWKPICVKKGGTLPLSASMESQPKATNMDVTDTEWESGTYDNPAVGLIL